MMIWRSMPLEHLAFVLRWLSTRSSETPTSDDAESCPDPVARLDSAPRSDPALKTH